LIKIPVSQLKINPENRPEEFVGEVNPVVVAPVNKQSDDDELPVLAFLPTHNSEQIIGKEFSEENDRQSDGDEAKEKQVGMKDNKTQSTLSVGQKNHHQKPELSANQENSSPVNQFIAWVKTGVQTGSIQVNHAHARVHVVNEGVLLMSPGIFQDYAKFLGDKDWIAIQKSFFKQNWHLKDPGGRNIMKYQVKGKEREKTVNGVLIPDNAMIFGTAIIPQPNPHLKTLIY
jgi:conjugal transfer pilus assembly protein TraI